MSSKATAGVNGVTGMLALAEGCTTYEQYEDAIKWSLGFNAFFLILIALQACPLKSCRLLSVLSGSAA